MAQATLCVAYFPPLARCAAVTGGNPEERRHSPMRDYEIVFIVRSDLEETAFNDVVERVRTWITEDGGEVVKTDLWGKRKLAYPIRKQTEGQYVLLETKMAPSFGAQLERNLRYLEPVLRYSVIVKE
jgi:small subunit ribosomal protein S6